LTAAKVSDDELLIRARKLTCRVWIEPSSGSRPDSWTAVSRASSYLSDVELTPVPVSRAADYAKAGKGRIILSDTSPLIVTGINTQFKSQLEPRSQLVLPKSAGYASAVIAEVISDTEVKLKSEFVVPSKGGSTNVKASERVRSEAEQKEGLEYKVLPHVEQEATYGAVFQRLKDAGCIGVFPEGELLDLNLSMDLTYRWIS